MYYVIYTDFDYEVVFIESEPSYTEFDSCTPHGPYKNFTEAREKAMFYARNDRVMLLSCLTTLRTLCKKEVRVIK